MMHRRIALWNLFVIAAVALSALLGAGATLGGPAAHAAPPPNGVTVGRSYKNDVSPPLRSITPIPAAHGAPEKEEHVPPITIQGHQNGADTVVQRSTAGLAPSSTTPSTSTSWDGVSDSSGKCGCAPPDPNGAVGPNDYVQTVNTAFQIWDKSGTSLYGPAAINTVWSGFGGACQSNNDGDPIVLYDSTANRWLISQLTSSSPYDECIAISTTGDPTGSWYRYAFQMSTTLLQDYPKIGVWPDGFYMSVNLFKCKTSFFGSCLSWTYQGPQAYVFNRSAMLAGQSTTFQAPPSPGSSHNPMLPADLDGALPPAGTPNYFLEDGGSLTLWKFHVDWTTPANTTFTNSASISTAPWTQLCSSTQDCIPQSGTTQKVDGLGDRLMYRNAYRNLGDHDVLMVAHNVDVGGGQAGVRWYEIRNPGGTPSVYQQGSYAPDSNSRWMGSAAMDADGDIAVGYSISSSSMFPSIGYATRVPSDPINTLGAEVTMQAGTGSQTGTNRWGDYTSMAVDPNGCTFWYTNEYFSATGSNWQTRIGSFAVPTCNNSTTALAVSAPSSATAGNSVNVTVTAKDASGNIAAGYRGTVHFTSSDGAATLPADYTFTAADAGSHTFAVTFNTSGGQTVTATDTSSGFTGTSGSVNVSSGSGGSATHFVVSAPANAMAGSAVNVTVTAADGSGNTATGYTGTVHFSSTDASAVLPANYTFTSSDAGSHTFSVTFKTAGNQTVTATDTNTASITGNAAVSVSPAAASTLGVTTPGLTNNTTTAGNSFSVTVTARDPYGNVATGYTGTVALTSSDSQASLPGSHTFSSGDAGIYSFSPVTLETAGSQTITATDTVASSITGRETITVQSASATSLTVNAPASASAGTAFNFSVTAHDAYGNTATGYTGTVSFTSTDTSASLPGAYTFTATDAGTHTFSATLNTTGNQTITATDSANSLSATSGTINVGAAATVPGAPTSVSATAGHKKATVNWAPPASNGSVISSYTITTYSGSSTSVVKTGSVSASTACPGSSCSTAVTNLRTGQSYSFTVAATNSVGTGPASSRSNTVTVQ